MTERTPAAADGRTAGQLLRAARESAGLDVATLAAQIKVPVAKIEAIESDRLEALPGLAFARGLAQTMCRVLKVAPEPVLSRLPRATGETLDEVSRGLNAPFRAGGGGGVILDLSVLRRPIVWGPVAFGVAALAVWLMPVAPFGSIPSLPTAPIGAAAPPPAPVPGTPPAAPVDALPGMSPAAPSTVASGPARGPGVDSTSIEVVHSAPAVAGAASQPADAGQPVRPLQLRAASSSWVEVRDARGAVLLSRTLQPGETVGVAGQLPFQAIVGNAAETSATVNGQPFDIGPHTRDNVARFEVR